MDWNLYCATPKWAASFITTDGSFGVIEFELVEPHPVVASKDLWVLAQSYIQERKHKAILMGLTPLTLMRTNPRLK